MSLADYFRIDRYAVSALLERAEPSPPHFIDRVNAQLDAMEPNALAQYLEWLDEQGWVTDLRTLEL